MSMNPTPEQIRSFCANLEKSLLQAQQRGEEVFYCFRQFHTPVYDYEKYGLSPTDLTHTGTKIIIEIGAPARQRRLDEEATRRHHEPPR